MKSPINYAVSLILGIMAIILILAGVSIYVHNATGSSFLGVFALLFILSLIPTKNARGALMAQGLSITELAAKLGAYYRENRDILISETLLDFDASDSFEVWDDVSDEVPLPNLSITDLIKPGDDTTFTPNNNSLNFGARILKVRNWKVDLLIQPRLLEKTWLGAFKKPGSGTQNLIFEAYIFNYIIKKIKENLRLQSVYRGVYNAAGVTPIDVMDGLLTLVTTEVAAGNITPVVTGAITQVNVVDKLLLTYDNLGEAYKAPVLNPAFVATDSSAMMVRPLMNQMPLSGTNCLLKREPGLGTSQRLICTEKENKVYGTDSLNDENSFKIQEFERSLKIMVDAKSGVQFKEINKNSLAVNDQV
jgi:hypothetical protein